MISILMPVKNASGYLTDTISSIINQSLTDWELIAVDDHSTDHSAKILKKFTQRDSRIKFYSNIGQGIIDALTLAQQQASGKYISRMDADDLMHHTKLSKMLTACAEHPRAIITSKVKYFSEEGLKQGYKKYEDWLNERMVKNDHYEEIYKECVLPSPNWLMQRSLLDKIGGFEQLEYPEDYDLCFRAYKNNIPIVGLNDQLHFWRDYPERTSRNHPHYADNSFLKLKTKYFLKVDHQKNKTLYLWGAGNKGKSLAKLLIQNNVNFTWMTDNPKKIDHIIYDIKLTSSRSLKDSKNAQVIVAVAAPKEQKIIKKQLQESGLESYFFC